MATDCKAQLTFQYQGLCSPIVARFDVPYASSDGGLVLLKAVDERLRLTSSSSRRVGRTGGQTDPGGWQLVSRSEIAARAAAIRARQRQHRSRGGRSDQGRPRSMTPRRMARPARIRERAPRYAISSVGPVVVDASIAFLWFANEPERFGADQLLEAESGLLASDLMAIEATNAW
jgi:hypothetical protein